MSVLRALQSFAVDCLRFAFPLLCPACGERLAGDDEDVCGACRDELLPVDPPWCECCGKHLQKPGDCCPNCKTVEPFLERARAACRFSEVSRSLVHRLKFDGRTELAGPLARMMVVAWVDLLEERKYDLVIPVPLHATRGRERGYNQSELLARELAALTGLTLDVASLRRTKATRTQTSLESKARWENVRGAFAAERTPVLKEAHVLLIDDVATTCATGQACAEALTAAGAASVTLLTFARA